MGLQDRTIPQVLALTGTPEAEMCIRCKYSLAMCNGATECMFDSNCFYAGKELKCRVCLRPTLVANHLVTKMCRGPYEGLYLHQVRACGRRLRVHAVGACASMQVAPACHCCQRLRVHAVSACASMRSAPARPRGRRLRVHVAYPS